MCGSYILSDIYFCIELVNFTNIVVVYNSLAVEQLYAEVDKKGKKKIMENSTEDAAEGGMLVYLLTDF